MRTRFRVHGLARDILRYRYGFRCREWASLLLRKKLYISSSTGILGHSRERIGDDPSMLW